MILKRILISSALFFTLSFSLATVWAPAAQALFFDNSKSQACQGVNTVSGRVDDPSTPKVDESKICDTNSGNSLNKIIALVINIFSIIAGIIAVVMVIVGGLKFITSAGDATKTASARNTILYAILGLVVVAFAQIIVHFVLNKTTLPKCPTGKTQIAKPGDCTP